MKKILTILLMIFLITGCSNNKQIKYELKNNDNYLMRIRIKQNLKIINNIMISKYNDQEIEYEDDNITYYQFGDKNYSTSDKKQLYKGKSNYNNYNILLSSLSKLKKVEKKEEDLIGDKTYEFINFQIDKKNFNDIMKSLNIDYDSKTDGNGYVYFDPEGYLYKIAYENETISIETTLSKFDGINKIYGKDISEVLK